MQYFIIDEKVFILFRYRGLTNDFCARSKVDGIILRLSMHRITIHMVHRLIEDGAIIVKTSNRLASCKIRPYLARMLAAHYVLVHFCSCQSAGICGFPCAGFPASPPVPSQAPRHPAGMERGSRPPSPAGAGTAP